MTIAPAEIESRSLHVIEVATELFWRNGYDGVSIGDLVEATGMNRYALYQTFGGKKEIFLACLDHYSTEAYQQIQLFLEEPGIDPFDAARRALIAKMLDPEMFPAGCLICTTAVDVAAKDQDIAAKMEECSDAIGALFAKGFAKAQAEGRASTSISPQAFAEMSTAIYFSTGVQARMGRSRESLLLAINQIVDSLKMKPST
ncbi:TetR/AcrR family transcriptional regulator [Parvularcula marina]|uniref:TetR/AcrR family transcriptional regulator n=1 Tax=Parvularcula marina TaxID=2292771 RepID=A0A371RGZ1_9PROT|nr:TetR/AcrR family transcriptional regulator [Parvularcula marina]RFB04716.1 TetR/AcrR family transcriptional regulator [Parvularcula marina]